MLGACGDCDHCTRYEWESYVSQFTCGLVSEARLPYSVSSNGKGTSTLAPWFVRVQMSCRGSVFIPRLSLPNQACSHDAPPPARTTARNPKNDGYLSACAHPGTKNKGIAIPRGTRTHSLLITEFQNRRGHRSQVR